MSTTTLMEKLNDKRNEKAINQLCELMILNEAYMFPDGNMLYISDICVPQNSGIYVISDNRLFKYSSKILKNYQLS